MKITKPKDNQILIEDDRLKRFTLDVATKTGLKDSEFNDLYDGLMFAYRLPGMDASKQIMFGNHTSVLTLTCSMLENLIRHGVMDERQLAKMFQLVIENLRRDGRNE